MNTKTDHSQENNLLVLADDMASAASHFSSHGYEEFVTARERFVHASQELMGHFKELQRLCKAKEPLLPLSDDR